LNYRANKQTNEKAVKAVPSATGGGGNRKSRDTS